MMLPGMRLPMLTPTPEVWPWMVQAKWLLVGVSLLVVAGLLCMMSVPEGRQLLRGWRGLTRDWQAVLPPIVAAPTVPRADAAGPPAGLTVERLAETASTVVTQEATDSALLNASVVDEGPPPQPVLASSGEEESRNAFEALLGVKFVKVRPAWLKNELTGRNLELDGFNAELHLAFEHQGAQHQMYPNAFHRTPEAFAAQVARDALKRQLAQAAGVTLLEIPGSIKRKDIRAYVQTLLVRHGYI